MCSRQLFACHCGLIKNDIEGIADFACLMAAAAAASAIAPYLSYQRMS
jgi:hypothetical protein